ncbi:carnitine palmitoyltransferase-like protein [Leptomonas pyrrhocoris]|uniref:Carnitine palmitoyltransferase-like protein n=1 Tax=Leptomonas pyrrhocoris TaxID=157538 RepID=A0A0N0DZT9_LEPPY|nr:carnitine palmitoyltransferase-like protein [Leptomonas pyrrhocoris]KPA85622.1 carnitine palmitoyltransferase-like protein [Leptomonas pyrrhocoris]|eukprot:XP_015664061.1 carnitine palmitoyltransferase-like protein [Leptomonas pyrrhocoris]
MRGSLPRMRVATLASLSGTGPYASGNWAALRETVSAASTDTVKDLLTPSLIPTRHFQRSLPKLPLPSLNDTLQRYLTTVQPLCSPSQHEATTRVVRAFKEQEGPRLQDELRRTDKANLHTSFISSDLFERRLKERSSLPLLSHKTWLVRPDAEKADMLVRSVYWLWASVHFYKLYLDNQLAPEVRYVSVANKRPEESSDRYWEKDWFDRTAALLPDLFSTPFVYRLSGGNVVPLDMSQFDCLFNSSRMPGVLQDEITPVGFVPQVTVQYRGHQFVITVADADCVPLSVDQLYAQLRDIVDTHVTPPRTDVGVFTSLPRSEWNVVRTMLLRDAANSKNMETIEESMFVLNLDDVAEKDDAADPLCAVGVMSKTPSLRPMNRWWDKSLSVTVNHQGTVAVSAEASWGDAVAVRRYVDDVYALSHAAHSDLLKRTAPSTYPVRQLQWNIPADLHGVAQRARRTLEGERQRLDVAAGVLDAPATSPSSVEATLQLAAQLAWWRLQHRPTCCFQTLDLQRYRRGRTEQICLTTAASADFVLSMLGKDTAAQRSACRAALQAYETLKRSVEKGQGIQCHLLALRMTAERLLGRVPELYRDPAFASLSQGGVCVDMMESEAAYGRGFAVNPFGFHLSCSRSGNSVLYQVSNLPSPTCAVPTSTSFAEAFSEACRDVDALQRSVSA